MKFVNKRIRDHIQFFHTQFFLSIIRNSF